MHDAVRRVAAGLVALVLAGVSDAAAQRPNRDAPPAVPQPIELKGKVAVVQPGMIGVEAEDGKYQVQIAPRDTLVVVTGTAVPESLRPGLFVRFSAELDNDRVTTPIEELTIITPSDQNPLGDFPEGDDPTQEGGPRTIVGQVKSFKKGRLQVGIPPKRVIRAELAESPKLDVTISDYSFVRAGDAIVVRGKQPGRGQVIADHVAVELAEPLGASSAKRKSPARGSRVNRRSGGASQPEQPQRDAPEAETAPNE